jgi:KipI family sensor histidine kinase inhibitor
MMAPMATETFSLAPASDSALLVRLGDRMAPEVSRRVRRLLRRLDESALAGVIDFSPAYASILIRFDPRRIDHVTLGTRVERLVADLDDATLTESPIVEIPVRYGGADGPDLEAVARFAGMTPDEVVALHSGTIYDVYFLGFTPGFAYLGAVPDRIACPRLETPRRAVPAGSVGIAGRQTGVYPSRSPGGWRLVGRTTVAMFDVGRTPMSRLAIGDRVRFVAAGPAPPPPDSVVPAR